MTFAEYKGPNHFTEGFGSPRLTFTVYGIPMPKGSRTTLKSGHTIEGAPSRSKDPEKRKEQRRRIVEWPLDVQGNAFIASAQIANRRTEAVRATDESIVAEKLAPLFEGPVCVTVRFYFPRPKNETKAERLRKYCTRKPDLDKLLRGVFDPMKKAGIFRDDSQVCRDGGSEKLYVPFDAVTKREERPRAEVSVVALQETE